ncbi:protein kinase domain-containing protein [Lysinibacillus pakistanensis]|uniref:protein kinase domain-containing protein n=1 Tax=Lysinibacillus pakistanensis TaxID=759811 RepID=UPI003D2DE001
MTYKGDVLTFKLSNEIGYGGNGKVYKITCIPINQEELVVKILKPAYGENPYPRKKYNRFKSEVTVASRLMEISDRFIPIRDYYLPAKPNRSNRPWFVMPEAISLKANLFNKKIPIVEKMQVVLDIILAIKDLHDNDYVHRDIKLDNILFYNSRVVLCDFGLVRHPSLERLTGDTEKVGPWNTIAPEMKRAAVEFFIPKQADIYSLGKLIWIILTEDELCFDGRYSQSDVMSLDNYYKDVPLRRLHILLEDMTKNEHIKRPNIEEVLSAINKWLHMVRDDTLIKKEAKIELYKKIEKRYSQTERVYSDFESIYNILNDLLEIHLISIKQINATIKIVDLRKSRVDGCIEMQTEQDSYIFKPQKLYLLVERNKWFIDITNIEDDKLSKAGIQDITGEKNNFLEQLFNKTLDNNLYSKPKILAQELGLEIRDDI